MKKKNLLNAAIFTLALAFGTSSFAQKEKTDYSDESEHPIPTKVYSRFDDDFLG